MKREHRESSHAARKYATHSEADVTRPTIEVYSDGGCRGNPGVGAWAALIYEGPKPKEIWGVERLTTNNQIELRAAIEALRALEVPSKVRIYRIFYRGECQLLRKFS
jgi:hypothetical protein